MRNFEKIAKRKGFQNIEKINDRLEEILINQNFTMYGCYFSGYVFSKGDAKTTNNFVFITDDGGFYKVGAEYMIWYWHEKLQEIVGIARWSMESLEHGLEELFQTGEITRDLEYQT